MGATCQGLATNFVGKGARLSSWSGVCCHKEAGLGGARASAEGVMPSKAVAVVLEAAAVREL